ncbi:MAG TPA: hypothetical protein VNC61_02440 [Acidimicrobiales bacterium]|nr:hypothetical protein [Acidimicrobiales bacterium]
MSDVAEWLMDNRERLEDIARATTMAPRVVHLVAVLTLAGLSDVQVRDELAAIGSRSEIHVPAKDLERVLALVRSLPTPGNQAEGEGRQPAP